MANMRVHELAKELNISSKEIIETLSNDTKKYTASNGLTDSEITSIRSKFGKKAAQPEKPKTEAKQEDKKSHISQVYFPQNSTKAPGNDTRKGNQNQTKNDNQMNNRNNNQNNNRKSDTPRNENGRNNYAGNRDNNRNDRDRNDRSGNGDRHNGYRNDRNGNGGGNNGYRNDRNGNGGGNNGYRNDRTAILVLEPASLAIPIISTMPSLISVTSSSKRRSTSCGDVLDTLTSVPGFSLLETLTT